MSLTALSNVGISRQEGKSMIYLMADIMRGGWNEQVARLSEPVIIKAQKEIIQSE